MSADNPAQNIKYFDPTKKLKQSEIDFMKIIEKQNFERVQKLKRTRRNNMITGLSIGGTVMGIYLYSMFAVKQERFLDDFEKPETVPIDQSKF